VAASLDYGATFSVILENQYMGTMQVNGVHCQPNSPIFVNYTTQPILTGKSMEDLQKIAKGLDQNGDPLSGIAISVDDGKTFTKYQKVANSIPKPSPSVFIHKNGIYVLVNDGVALSEDDGETFEILSDKSDAQEIFVDSDGYVYLQDTANEKSFFSRDNGKSWIELDFSTSEESNPTTQVVALNDKIYVASKRGLLVVSKEKYRRP
jgi:hypothetical protein